MSEGPHQDERLYEVYKRHMTRRYGPGPWVGKIHRLDRWSEWKTRTLAKEMGQKVS